MDALLQDLRYAIRTLLASPRYAAAVVVCLALGIGANATMFSVVDTLLFRPPSHVRDPGHVVRINFSENSTVFGRFTQSVTSYPAYTDLRDGVRGFSSVAAYWTTGVDVGRGPGAEQVRGSLVSSTLFPLLGVAPAFGRFFGADEDRPGGARVAVLGYAYWRRRYGGDSLALGRTLQVGSGLYTVIGVAPEGFNGADLDAVDLWLPISPAGPQAFEPDALSNRDDAWLRILARLGPGATLARAASEATAVFRRGLAAQPWHDPNGVVVFSPIQVARGPEISRDAKVSVWLSVVSGIVLLIACANVANLLLARAMRRKREIAVRLALGASRGRLARQLLTESGLLALLGGAAALLVALWGGPLIRAFVLPKGVALQSVLDLRILLFTAAVAAFTGVVSGLVPALQASRPDLAVALKAGEREGACQRSAVRSALLIGQTGLTLVLLVGAGLFVRSLKNVLGLDLGVDTRHLLVATVDTRSAGYTWAETILLYQRMLERAQRLPGIEQAALSLGGPFGSSFAFTVRVSGRDSVPFLKSGGPYYNAVTPGFFATLGTRIVRGRGFTDADHRGAGKVAVLGQTMSRLLWPGHDALGQCIKLGEDSTCTQVVGIAADARRYQLLEDPQMQFYVPLDQDEGRYSRRTLFLRTSLEPHATAEMVRRALASLAPDLPYVNVQSVQDAVEPQLRPWRLGATVFGLFGGLALLLAAFGLYGMLAYTVAQRSQEMGVRIALGAEASDVVGLVVRQGLRVVAIGLGLGLTVALAASRAVASLLYGVKPDDPLVLAVAALVLVVAALVASYFPARRATRVDPVVALRSE